MLVSAAEVLRERGAAGVTINEVLTRSRCTARLGVSPLPRGPQSDPDRSAAVRRGCHHHGHRQRRRKRRLSTWYASSSSSGKSCSPRATSPPAARWWCWWQTPGSAHPSACSNSDSWAPGWGCSRHTMTRIPQASQTGRAARSARRHPHRHAHPRQCRARGPHRLGDQRHGRTDLLGDPISHRVFDPTAPDLVLVGQPLQQPMGELTSTSLTYRQGRGGGACHPLDAGNDLMHAVIDNALVEAAGPAPSKLGTNFGCNLHTNNAAFTRTGQPHGGMHTKDTTKDKV